MCHLGVGDSSLWSLTGDGGEKVPGDGGEKVQLSSSAMTAATMARRAAAESFIMMTVR